MISIKKLIDIEEVTERFETSIFLVWYFLKRNKSVP